MVAFCLREDRWRIVSAVAQLKAIAYELRPYQRDAINAINAAHASGNQGALLVVPTGGGKTIIFSRIASALSRAGACVLVVVSAVELVGQTRDKLLALGCRCGVIAASFGPNPDPSALIQVAMVQTLRTRPRAMLREPAYIIFDEAHLAAAESYRLVRERYPRARRLGVTATPWRMDDAGFEDLASIIVPGPSIAELQEDGFLVPFRVRSIAMTQFAASKRSRTEFNHKQVSDAYTAGALVGSVVDHWCEEAGSTRSGLVFAASIEHSRKLCAEFLARGVAAEHVDGETDKGERRLILARLASGVTQVVCNFGVLIAGFDCPRVEVVSIARATASKSLWIQMAGRGLRICPEVGKTDAVILDHGGNRFRHGALGGPHVYSLTGRSKAANDDAPLPDPGRECPRCHTIDDDGADTCRFCGYDFVDAAARARAERVPEVIAGTLVDIAESVVFDVEAHQARNAKLAAEHMRARAVDRAESMIGKLRRTG